MKFLASKTIIYDKGYSLISLMVMLSALVFTTSTAFIVTADSEDERRDFITKTRYQKIRDSIFGPSEKMVLNGSVAELGYVNDVGALPRGNDLSDLATRSSTMKPWGRLGSDLNDGSLPAASSSILSQIELFDGWRGPYVQSNSVNGSPTKDGWGYEFTYTSESASDDSFNNSVTIYSMGRDNRRDVAGDLRGYNDDYPFASASEIQSESYNSQIKAFPNDVSINLPIASTDACNYFVGMIYPGLDLRESMGIQGASNCAVVDAEVEIEEVPYSPSLPGSASDSDPTDTGIASAGGSFACVGFTLNNNTTLAGSVLVYGTRPTVNLNQSVSEGSPFSGDLWLRGNPIVNVNGNRNSGVQDRIFNFGVSNDRPRYRVNVSASIGLNSINTNFGLEVNLPPHFLAEPSTGRRWVNLDNPSQSIGDASTLRGLNVNSGYNSDVILPPGAYDSIGMSQNSRLVLGNVGDTEPAVYSFRSLNMNNCDVVLVGPVQIRVQGGLNLQRLAGNSENPDWLDIYATGNVNMNSNSTVYGDIYTRGGRVTINSNSTVTGVVIADALTMNNNSRLLNGFNGPISTGDNDTRAAAEALDEAANSESDENENSASDGDDSFLPTHPAFNFSQNPLDLENRKIVSLEDFVASQDSTEQLGLISTGTDPLYMNKRFARRYQLAIFSMKQQNAGFEEGSLAASLVSVLPGIYTTQSGN